MGTRHGGFSEPKICPKCPHSMIVHQEDGTCVVCQSKRAETPCFVHRGKILVDTIVSGLPGEYVGRRIRARHGSPLGNPFKIKTDAEREDAVARYKVWCGELDWKGLAVFTVGSYKLEQLHAGFTTGPIWCMPIRVIRPTGESFNLLAVWSKYDSARIRRMISPKRHLSPDSPDECWKYISIRKILAVQAVLAPPCHPELVEGPPSINMAR